MNTTSQNSGLAVGRESRKGREWNLFFKQIPFAAVLVLPLFGSPDVWGSVPQLMRLQGRFTDSRRTPLTDTLPVRFTVFDTDMGGRPLWQEIQTVSVRESAFQVVLGRINPLPASVFDGTNHWLEMQIGENAPMRPRHRIPANYGLSDNAVAAPAPAPVPVEAPVVKMAPVDDQRVLETQIDQYSSRQAAPVPVPAPAVVPVVAPAPVAKPVAPAPKPVAKKIPKIEGVTVGELGPVYEARNGDTLRSIAKKLYGNPDKWYDLYTLNQDRLGPMGYVTPGQLIILPKEILEGAKP